jgi:hypothetical protein
MIKTTKIDDAYIVSQYDTWVQGRYASEEAARLACQIDPDVLNSLYEKSIAEGKEGMIAMSDLVANVKERA